MTVGVSVSRLTAEHHREPLGIGEREPRLSWQVATDVQGWAQVAYELHVRADDGGAWPTGRVESTESVLVPWPAPALRSRDRRHVAVRVWGRDDDEPSPWSDELTVEAGLLDAADWTAKFVGTGHTEGPLPLLRKEFKVSGDVVSARLYATAFGVYELELNGAKVGDQLFAPGWTSYHQRLRYQTYDVTAMLAAGRNAVGAWLADGWYRGQIGWDPAGRARYGTELALLAQLEITYADGSTTVVGTDRSWRHAPGPLVSSSWYHGEHYDTGLERAGWSSPRFKARGWRRVRPMRHHTKLVAPTGPPVRATTTVAPVGATTAPSGGTVVDFGQNLVGHLRLTLRGGKGDVIEVRHAEVLEPDGELCTRPLYDATATDVYVSRGDEVEVWEPRFTSHGFRYAEINGWPGELDLADVIAVVCHSDMERTGDFSCSDPLLDRLHENVVWSLRGNFVDVPTDCPQRSERLGWTGDAQVFAPTAAYLYQSAGVLGSWLADLAAEQTSEGYVPPFVPFVNVDEDIPRPPHAFAAWGDAATVVPWVLYERFGDTELLRRRYGGMKAWVDAVHGLVDHDLVWRQGFQFGDWLDPVAPPEEPAAGRTPAPLVATACFARCAALVSRAAAVLGKTDDQVVYRDLAARVRSAFQAEYVTGPGELSTASQTAYALALGYDLLPDDESRRHAVRRLADLVRDDDYRIGTGFVGTPMVCDALTDGGELDTAYQLVLQRECPSWLYQVTMGATTIWERWDSLLPDGTVNPGHMTSFNHYAYGAVADWLHRVVGGLAPAAPGYRRLLVRPRPGGGLTHATTSLHTPYGPAEVSWRLTDGTLTTDVAVPPGTEAHVVLSSTEPVDVGSGRHTFTVELG